MGRKARITIVLALFALFAMAAAAYAVDTTRSNEIAEGVTIGGVDVGGLTSDEATQKVESQLLTPLDQSVTVTFEGVRYVLSSKKLAVSADVEASVDKALEASRDGGLPSRVWRYVTGGSVDKSISPTISYDQEAVDQFAATVADEVNREPVDASVEPSAGAIEPVDSQTGVTLEEEQLAEEIGEVADSTDEADRTIEAGVIETQPNVTTEQLAEQYPVYITVDRSSFELKLWKDLELATTYSVAIGAIGYDTPTGLYHIQNKAEDPTWHVPDSDWAGDLAGQVIPGGAPNNPLKARWMGIYDGAGIHGTDDIGSLGSAASHGCVRMAVEDVISLYPEVPVGTPIYID